MSKFYFSISFLLMMAQISKAQIVFDYDNAGNRILRKAANPLPVTLVSFTAKASVEAEEYAALLTWHTSSEINSDRFDVERSQGGKKWLIIGSVAASGDKVSDSWYSFLDKVPLEGENLYRLKMVDVDDSFCL